MTPIRQWINVGMVIMLATFFLLYNQSERKSLLDSCGHKLEGFAQRLVDKAERQDGVFPTALGPVVPVCPDSPHAPCRARYEVTPDRRFFALWCPYLHDDRWNTHNAVAGDTQYQGSARPPTRGTLEDCRKQLLAEAAFVENLDPGKLDREALLDYEGFRSYACGQSHEICFRKDGSYQIVCCTAHHISHGLRPLQPRYDSSRDKLIERPFEPFDKPPERSVVLNPKFHVGVLLLVLILIALRHAFFGKTASGSTKRGSPTDFLS